jgi:hypothetical protein
VAEAGEYLEAAVSRLSGGFDAYESYAACLDGHSLRRLRAICESGKSCCGATGVSPGKMIGSYA